MLISDMDGLVIVNPVRKTYNQVPPETQETYKARELAAEVANEVARARSMFPAIYSPHEGLAIIREEYLEFEAEVWKYNLFKNRDTRPQMRTELIQLAAMALRTILDTIDKDGE